MYCVHCGSEIKGTEKFCPHCGASLAAGPSGGGTPPLPEQVQKQTAARKKKEKRPRRAAKDKPKKEYKKTTALGKTVTVILTVFLFLFGFVALTVASFRIGMTENNVRYSYRTGKLSDFSVSTASGKTGLVKLITDGACDAETGEHVELEKKKVKEILEKPYVNRFAEDVLVDYAGYLVFGKDPENLTADAICRFLSSVSNDLKYGTGYSIPAREIESVRERITGGDLNHLNAGDEDGKATFKGFDLRAFPVLFSLWSLIICCVVSAGLIALIFVVNRKNPPAAFGSAGTALTLFGSVNLIIALSACIVAAVNNNFFISPMVRIVAMSGGTVCRAVVAVGICLLLTGRFKKKNSVVAE